MFVKKKYGEEVGYEPVGFVNVRLDSFQTEYELMITRNGPDKPACVVGKVKKISLQDTDEATPYYTVSIDQVQSIE